MQFHNQNMGLFPGGKHKDKLVQYHVNYLFSYPLATITTEAKKKCVGYHHQKNPKNQKTKKTILS